MLKTIQRRYLQKITNLNLEKRNLVHVNNKMHTLGFLVEEEYFNDFEKLYEMASKMGLQHKDVKIFTFLNVKKKLPSLRQNQINNKEFSWNGIIYNQNATEFLEQPLDVLIGFYKEENPFMNLMISKSVASFKIGFRGIDDRLFDLIINVEPINLKGLEIELIKYLKVLNKIN